MNHCDKEMDLLTKEYNGYDDVIGEWYWCSICGTVYYKDTNIRHCDASHYMIPSNKENRGMTTHPSLTGDPVHVRFTEIKDKSRFFKGNNNEL